MGASQGEVKGQRLKSQGGLTSETYGELSLNLYNLCEKVGQKPRLRYDRAVWLRPFM